MFSYKKTVKTESTETVSVQTPFYFQFTEYNTASFAKLTENNELVIIREAGDYFCVYSSEFIISEKLNRMDHEIDAEQFNWYRLKLITSIDAI